MAGDRVRAGEYAERINAAADLPDAGVPVAEAARVLAGRFGCSQRQGRRYAERAAQTGRVDAPQATTAFTVKLPGALAAAGRAQARAPTESEAGREGGPPRNGRGARAPGTGRRAEERRDDRVADSGIAGPCQ